MLEVMKLVSVFSALLTENLVSHPKTFLFDDSCTNSNEDCIMVFSVCAGQKMRRVCPLIQVAPMSRASFLTATWQP